MLNVRLPAEVKDALVRAAKADERTISVMTVRVLRAWLVEQGFLKSENAPSRRGKG